MFAAIYCRLSKEDDEKTKESESIQNQKSLLLKYAVEQSWDVYEIYADDDYSGIDSQRPAFRRMIADAEAGKFQIVLCKTQSRFTRDMELVEHYIHRRFVEWGIRFVAVVDHVDTDIRGNKKARQINGLINEWYLEDLSENIRAVFDHKRRQGQYMGGFPVYGYIRDSADRHKLAVEPQAAAVVQRIFALYLQGHGKLHIATVLNEEGVLNPTKHKQMLGMGYTNGFAVNDYGLWNRTSVGRILRERMYTGDLIQGKRKKPTYKSKGTVPVPESGWYITENAHEAIIERDTFQTVQQMLGERTRSDGSGEVHPLGGKVRCMECGSTMAKVSHSTAHGRNSYLRCKLHATDKRKCFKNVIYLGQLEEQVLILLREHVKTCFDRGGLDSLSEEGEQNKQTAALETEMQTLKRNLEQRSKAIRDLYLDKSRGLIGEEQFLELNSGYLAEKNRYQRRLDVVAEELGGERGEQQPDPAAVRAKLEKWLGFETLTREVAAAFIDYIEVGKPDVETNSRNVHIHWLF